MSESFLNHNLPGNVRVMVLDDWNSDHSIAWLSNLGTAIVAMREVPKDPGIVNEVTEFKLRSQIRQAHVAAY